MKINNNEETFAIPDEQREKFLKYTNVTDGKMFRRFSIAVTENLTNQTNYLAALKGQGFSESTNDNLLTRVWWDKE